MTVVFFLDILFKRREGKILSISCPKCDAENPDNQKLCGGCGTKLETTKNISITKTLKPLRLSQTIADKYKLLEELGRGGMGIVYKATDTRLDRTVALKFLPEELTKDEEAKQRFILEAKAAAALNHPRICTIYEIDEADNQSFIAMEYIDGQSLKDKLKSGPLEVEEAKHIAIQVAEGLKEAHERGIIHRDIKPAIKYRNLVFRCGSWKRIIIAIFPFNRRKEYKSQQNGCQWKWSGCQDQI